MATASAHRHGGDGDEETENEDVTGQSDDVTSQSDGRSSSGLSLTAFESFVRDMVGNHDDLAGLKTKQLYLWFSYLHLMCYRLGSMHLTQLGLSDNFSEQNLKMC